MKRERRGADEADRRGKADRLCGADRVPVGDDGTGRQTHAGQRPDDGSAVPGRCVLGRVPARAARREREGQRVPDLRRTELQSRARTRVPRLLRLRIPLLLRHRAADSFDRLHPQLPVAGHAGAVLLPHPERTVHDPESHRHGGVVPRRRGAIGRRQRPVRSASSDASSPRCPTACSRS